MMSSLVLTLIFKAFLGTALAVPVKETVFSFDNNEQAVEGQCPDGLSPHKKYCDLFYSCYQNVSYLMTCPRGLVFDEKGHACSYPSELNCGHLTLRYPASCPSPYGSFRNEADCGATFNVCANGGQTKMKCPPGLRFNEESMNCEHDESPCKSLSQSIDSVDDFAFDD